MLKPLLKKSGADHELFSNFRPVSNLYFLSKVTEKADPCCIPFIQVRWVT